MSNEGHQRFYPSDEVREFVGWLANHKKLTKFLNDALKVGKDGGGRLFIPGKGTFEVVKVKV